MLIYVPRLWCIGELLFGVLRFGAPNYRRYAIGVIMVANCRGEWSYTDRLNGSGHKGAKNNFFFIFFC